ncbi:MAG: hypothetical protein LBR57_01715 [Alistipes sp.]|jgi:hypothetical protein|nr:hypothetical protein [Alistipes sp.]
MKKILVAVIALGAVAFASCSRDTGVKTLSGEPLLSLNIKLEGMTDPGATRMTEAAGQTGQLVLSNGHIFVIDPAGTVIANAVMNVTTATSAAGQTVNAAVATNSRVYILGNIPSNVDVTTLTTFERIRQTAVTISTSQQNNYRNAAMANTSGQPAAITVSGTTGSVTVEINPLYSRLELNEVRGGPTITGFTVTGVFVDSYFPSFTLTGDSSGPIRYQSQSTNFAGVMGDTGNWVATGAAGNMFAVPAAGQVWAYHMASADLPRIIVRLENVTTTGTPQPGTRYLTVTGYSGQAPTRFERGRIYQITSLTFTDQQLAATPNPTHVPITVIVRQVDWIPTPLTPVV